MYQPHQIKDYVTRKGLCFLLVLVTLWIMDAQN